MWYKSVYGTTQTCGTKVCIQLSAVTCHIVTIRAFEEPYVSGDNLSLMLYHTYIDMNKKAGNYCSAFQEHYPFFLRISDYPEDGMRLHIYEVKFCAPMLVCGCEKKWNGKENVSYTSFWVSDLFIYLCTIARRPLGGDNEMDLETRVLHNALPKNVLPSCSNDNPRSLSDVISPFLVRLPLFFSPLSSSLQDGVCQAILPGFRNTNGTAYWQSKHIRNT